MTGRSAPRLRADDRGFSLVFTALLLVVLMLFASFAVDLGGVYGARRLDQNAADTGSTGGALNLRDTDAALAAKVTDLVHGTLETTLTGAQWNSCGAVTDPDNVDVPLSGHNCITVNGGRTRIQVRIPTQQYDAVFARVVGIDDFDHSAFAIAGVVSAGFGGVLPFGMPASAGGGDGHVCIKSGSGGTSVPPCDGPDSGNFGYVDFGHFGSEEVNTATDCGNGGQRPRAANNMAVGVDHDLSEYGGTPHGITEVVDTIACAGSPQTPQPNAMDTLTGNTVVQALAPGIAFGTGFSDGGPGRLARTSPNLFDGSGSTADVAGTDLDDNPLWEFIPASFPVSASVPASCHKSVFTDVLGGDLSNLPANVQDFLEPKGQTERMRQLIQRCFTHYEGQAWTGDGSIQGGGDPSSCPGSGCNDPVFSVNSSTSDEPDLYDIQYTSRFGYVPQLTTDFPSGNATVRIAAFRAIFIQRLLGNCSSNNCGLDHEPGLSGDSSGADEDLEAITAFVFPPTMLPGGLGDSDAPFEIGKNRFVQLIR